MTLAQFVDVGSLVVAAVTPVGFVLRWQRWGVVLGAAFAWLLLLVAGNALSALDPTRDAALTDSIWFLFGCPAMLIYCSILDLAIGISRALWSRRRRKEKRAAV